MSDSDKWRYQRPDGSWVRWNPGTQVWEREDLAPTPAEDPTSTEPVVESRADPAIEPDDSRLPAGPPEDPVLTPAPAKPEPEVPTEPPRERNESHDPASAAAYSSAPEVIGREEEPRRSVLPALLVGAVIGIAIGIALLLYFR